MNQDKEKTPAGQGEGHDTRKVNQMSNSIIPIRRDLKFPPRPEDAYHKDGYVYIVEFNDGTVKVGKAKNLQIRLANHRQDAEKFKLSIAQWWGSPLHRDYADTEKLLIEFASGTGDIHGGREYFTGVSFDRAVEFASSLHLAPTPSSVAAAEIEESEESTKEFVRSLFPNSKYPRIYVDSWSAAVALGAFFDPTEDLPEMSGDLLPETRGELFDLAEGIASDQGVDADVVAAWSSYDWMCHLLDTAVRSAKLGMRIRIAEEGRQDLYESWMPWGETA